MHHRWTGVPCCAHLAVLGLVSPAAAAAVAGCGMGDEDQPGTDGGMNGSGMPEWMMSDGMMDGPMMLDMRVIHHLFTNHAKIRREVDAAADGIRSRTTSTDPQLAALIRTHAQAMRGRIEDNRPIRHGDPLFREIFERHTAITIEITDLPDGVQVTEASTDPQVQPLIR